MTPGQDIIVTFDGIDHPAELEKIEDGWYHCRILIDPNQDYGSITPRLAPHSIVCVRSQYVRNHDTPNTQKNALP